MVFSSLHFLYIFLPAAMLLHLLAPGRFKNAALLAASVYFYAWGEPVYVGLMLFSVAYNYFAGCASPPTACRCPSASPSTPSRRCPM